MMKKTTVLSILLLFALSLTAGNRSKKEMRDIAASALATYGVDGKVTGHILLLSQNSGRKLANM